MADKQLFHVRKEFVKRVKEPAIKQLLDDLLDDRVINAGEKDAIIEANNTTADKARSLIDTVQNKGPKASEKLLSSLKDQEPHLYELLMNLVLPESPAAAPDTPQQESNAVSPVLVTCTEQFKRELLKRDAVEIYDMMPKGPQRKRQALLINNVKFDLPSMLRSGAEKDEEKMEKLLQEMGYTVDKHSNLSAQDIEEAVKSFSQHDEHWQSDSAFVVIMSHGKRDFICGIHYDPDEPEKDLFSIDNIFKYLNSQNCPALLDKPKVIVIQACRGDEEGFMEVSDSVPNPSGLEDDGMTKQLTENDFICLMSCTPDTKAYRNEKAGSFLIQKLVPTINTHAHKDHMEKLFRKVKKQFNHPDMRMQMPCTDRSTLIKKFFLFPGQ